MTNNNGSIDQMVNTIIDHMKEQRRKIEHKLELLELKRELSPNFHKIAQELHYINCIIANPYEHPLLLNRKEVTE